MEIVVVESRPLPQGVSGQVPHQEQLDPGRWQDRALGALMGAGMSEQTAQEQVPRLLAGDVWSG